MRFSVKLLLATCIGLAATSAMAVDDGPRAYFPVPVGVLRDVELPTHSDLIDAQIEQAKAKSGEGDLAQVLLAGETWTVE